MNITDNINVTNKNIRPRLHDSTSNNLNG